MIKLLYSCVARFVSIFRLEFILNGGISAQLESFKQGFNSVFAFDKLSIFTPQEVMQSLFLLCDIFLFV